jgi:glycosyltransferase involved in cell wall biosynthesis/DNA-binding MarR family transcriptional regulator
MFGNRNTLPEAGPRTPELADIVSRLRRAMRRAARAADPALGLSVAQLELLSCIAENPGIRPSQLARLLRLAPSSVATLLHGLQSSGYVIRTPGGGAGDRRTASLHLSAEGTAAVTRWHGVNEEIIRAALATLPEPGRAVLRDAAPALRDLTAAIDALADLALTVSFGSMPLVSVVIPVHGVAEYLDRCLDSVLGEQAVPIEVIAVDDASPDRSAAILAARTDPRLRVIRTSVAVGPGPARELGAKEAAGEYVWFVDGDDELAEGALAAVARSLAELRPDVLIVDFENLYPDGTTSPSGGDLTGPQAGTLADNPRLIHLTMTAWSKVFRREFLAGLGTSFGTAPHEDVPVTTVALITAARIGVLNRVCYRYRRERRGSFLAGPSDRNFNIFSAYDQVFKFLSERSAVRPLITPAVRAALLERAMWHYTTLLPLVPRRRRREFFHQMAAGFRRWRPEEPGEFSFPPGPRGLKLRLAAHDAYWAYLLLEPVNRLRLVMRVKK